MPVLKSQQAGSMLKSALVLDLGDLNRQAARIREAAERQARTILEEAEAQADRIRQEARPQGLAQGHAEGLQKGLAEGREAGRREAFQQASQSLDQVQQAWISALADFESRREDLHREARTAVVELAVAIAGRLVHRCVQVDPTVIRDQVAAALTLVLRPCEAAVHIHPEDRAAMDEAMPSLAAQFPRLQHLRLQDDASVARGGCVVVYGQGQIDATLETQMRRLVEALLPGRDVAAQRQTPATQATPPAGEADLPTAGDLSDAGSTDTSP